MKNLLTEYPSVSWKQDWEFVSASDSSNRLTTTEEPGIICAPGASWTLQLAPSLGVQSLRLFCNGISIREGKGKNSHVAEAILVEPGVLTGRVQGFPPPELRSSESVSQESGLSWVKDGSSISLLIIQNGSFSFVSGDFPIELARIKAEDALEKSFESLVAEETERRQRTSNLFSINPRHNPPVALAAESLRSRLRERTGAIHGLWSVADGFECETYSLNELYPLTRAWLIIDPDIALQLVQTALSLQQNSGGFPAWKNEQNLSSPATAWPLIIQSFEQVWLETHDSVLLKQTLPALRKYMLNVLRQFDPQREQIATWQSEQEVFIPNSFERSKATPELTVMLIGELEALLRLCAEQEDASAAMGHFKEEHELLVRTLTITFWNPGAKAFSNVWKSGHIIHELSFASFMPLLWKELPLRYKKPLLERFEETHRFPGQKDSLHQSPTDVDDTNHLPIIHQFMALEALRCADRGRALLMMFVRRAREGFLSWFEHETIDATRKHHTTASKGAYVLGPVTACLVLTSQKEFQFQATSSSSFLQKAQQLMHRTPFKRSDLHILLIAMVAILLTHLAYNIKETSDEEALLADAVLAYEQGRFFDTIQICRKFPESPISNFLHANLLMITDNSVEAQKLYHKVLLKHPESPSALFGYSLSLQMNGHFELAFRRYNDFIDIHEYRLKNRGDTVLLNIADYFIQLTEEEFSRPPKWKDIYSLQFMNDLGL